MNTDKDLINILAIGWIIWFVSVILAFVLFQQTLFFPALVTCGYLTGAFLLNPDKKIYSRFWLFLNFVWDFYHVTMKKRFISLHRMLIVNSICQLLYLSLILILGYAIAYVFLSFLTLFSRTKPLEIKEIITTSWVLFANKPIFLLTWIVGVFSGNLVINLLEVNHEVDQ